jgi:hypothetical protein
MSDAPWPAESLHRRFGEGTVRMRPFASDHRSIVVAHAIVQHRGCLGDPPPPVIAITTEDHRCHG